MSHFEYSVDLAKARTKEELLEVAKDFLLKKAEEGRIHPPKSFRDIANGE